MLANYHTHTTRCGHANGTEREYIERAIAVGIRTLGFSDHVPYPFPGGYESSYRVPRARLAEYIDTLLALRAEYKNRIDIKIGFECEYYPLYFSDLLASLDPYPYDYLIMGQHFLGNEIDVDQSIGAPTADTAVLDRYVAQVIEGLRTGCFTYLAHPDMIRFTGDDDLFVAHIAPLLAFCRRCSIPLEINFYGYDDGRVYPSERFFRAAAEAGCKAILGCDAHTPQMVGKESAERGCLALAARVGIPVLDDVVLRDPHHAFRFD